MPSKGVKARVPLSDDQFHAISRALADPRRFAIFQQVAGQKAMGCNALAEHQVISPATISHHLKELSEAGLIEVEHVGRAANLSLRRDVWMAYLERLGAIAG
jgi:ArsR family transcriptional regulator, arsenate/arsenite/antimonite-responsive transcriptional repressor